MVIVRLLTFLMVALFNGCSTFISKEIYMNCGKSMATSLDNNGDINCKSPNSRCQKIEFKITCDVYRW